MCGIYCLKQGFLQTQEHLSHKRQAVLSFIAPCKVQSELNRGFKWEASDC